MCHLNGRGRLSSLVYFLFCYATVSLSFSAQIRLGDLSSLYLQINATANEASFTLPSVAEERLVKATSSEGVFCSRIFLLCTLRTTHCRKLIYDTAKTQTLCGMTQDILLLKGTKHQLSMYDTTPMVHRFFHACLTFQFRSSTVTEVLQTRR
jgi:hypothetical protein